MKARIPVPKSYRKQVDEYVRESSTDYIRSQKLEFTRRTIKLMCVVLNEMFGFGKIRLTRLVVAMSDFTLQRADDPVYWKHIDDKLINEIGLDFERENYEEMDE